MARLAEVSALARHVGPSDDVKAGGVGHERVVGLKWRLYKSFDDWMPTLYDRDRAYATANEKVV